VDRTRIHRPRPSQRLRTAGALVTLSLLVGTGCAKKLPPQLPTSSAYGRIAARVELVDLVISDPVRAEKVRALYVEMAQLMRNVRKAQVKGLVSASVERSPTEAATHAAVDQVEQAELAAFRRYVELQLEVRRSTSPAEFARLDAIK